MPVPFYNSTSLRPAHFLLPVRCICLLLLFVVLRSTTYQFYAVDTDPVTQTYHDGATGGRHTLFWRTYYHLPTMTTAMPVQPAPANFAAVAMPRRLFY